MLKGITLKWRSGTQTLLMLLPQVPCELEYYVLFCLLCFRKTVTDFEEKHVGTEVVQG